jgi:hypothetical protein
MGHLHFWYTYIMATKIYDTDNILLIDDTELYLTPLKIRYLREFMEKFENVKGATNDDEAIEKLVACALVAMKQYYPSIKTSEQLEDVIDLKLMYKILDIAAGIKIDPDKKEKETVKEQAEDSGGTWETLDLARLEAEAFLLGIWKDYEELEMSLSMPELTETLKYKRENEHNDRKFLAAIQGVDIDKDNKQDDAWERMKARVFTGKSNADPNDITSLQGASASKAGFGIGMGLGYEDLTKK